MKNFLFLFVLLLAIISTVSGERINSENYLRRIKRDPFNSSDNDKKGNDGMVMKSRMGQQADEVESTTTVLKTR